MLSPKQANKPNKTPAKSRFQARLDPVEGLEDVSDDNGVRTAFTLGRLCPGVKPTVRTIELSYDNWPARNETGVMLAHSVFFMLHLIERCFRTTAAALASKEKDPMLIWMYRDH